MKRLATVSTILVVAAIVALFLTSMVWSVEKKPGSMLAAVRSVARPRIKTVGPVRITGQIKKGLSKADARKLTAPREDSRAIRIPKARVHTVKESAAVLSKIKGGQAFLKSVPVPRSGSVPDSASLLLTPLKPRGSLSGVASAFIWLNGVWMSYEGTSLEESARQDRVCMVTEEFDGTTGVMLNGMEPGWYVVAADFVARSDGSHSLRGIWRLVDEGNGGEFEVSGTLKRGDELFLPVMFQVTRSNSNGHLNFHTTGQQIWFRSVSVQKLN